MQMVTRLHISEGAVMATEEYIACWVLFCLSLDEIWFKKIVCLIIFAIVLSGHNPE